MTDDELLLIAARSRVAALCAVLEKTEGAPVRLIETHISWVFIAGAMAYKLKKPVHLPFLDFRTLASLRHFCEEELRLNLRFAPALYLDVVDVCDGPDGPSFGGAGRLLDFAVRMHRFPTEHSGVSGWPRERSWRRMSMLLRAASPTIIAVPLSRQREAPSGRRRSTTAWSTDLSSLSTCGKPALPERTPSGRTAPMARRPAQPPRSALAGPLGHGTHSRMPRRSSSGQRAAIRRRDDRLRCDRIRRRAALDRHARRPRFPGDGSACAWPSRLRLPAPQRLSGGQWRLRRPASVALLPGVARSGSFARRCARQRWRHRSCGRLHGRPLPEARRRTRTRQRSAAGHHARIAGLRQDLHIATAAGKSRRSPRSLGRRAQASVLPFRAAILARARAGRHLRRRDNATDLFANAGGGHSALAAGWPTIVDAAFLCRAERVQFAALACADAAPFAILDCRAGLPLLHRRIASRKATGGDASEADVAVLERLMIKAEPLDDSETALALAIDAEQPLPVPALASRWLGMR